MFAAVQTHLLGREFKKSFSFSSSQSEHGICGAVVWYLDQQVCLTSIGKSWLESKLRKLFGVVIVFKTDAET